jgi:hypothetical protein
MKKIRKEKEKKKKKKKKRKFNLGVICVCMYVCTGSKISKWNRMEQNRTEWGGMGKMECFVNRVGIDIETASAGILF